MIESKQKMIQIEKQSSGVLSSDVGLLFWNRGASCWVLIQKDGRDDADAGGRKLHESQRQKDGRDDADAGGRKLHESPTIIALVDSSTDSPSCWIDRRFPDARTLDFLVRSSKSPKSEMEGGDGE
ncbi:hypothetical protein LXL04_035077 [Taraxacum kok-saghyz]